MVWKHTIRPIPVTDNKLITRKHIHVYNKAVKATTSRFYASFDVKILAVLRMVSLSSIILFIRSYSSCNVWACVLKIKVLRWYTYKIRILWKFRTTFRSRIVKARLDFPLKMFLGFFLIILTSVVIGVSWFEDESRTIHLK